MGTTTNTNFVWIHQTRVLNFLSCRHKILDVIGDLSLVGYPVVGHLVAHRGGHALHTAFAAKILEEVDAWRLVDADGEVSSAALPRAVPAKADARLAN